MATMNISLPDSLKAWAESRTEIGQYDTMSDYVRDLIRRDQERDAALVEFRRLVNEGLESGISTATMDEIWNDALAIASRSKT
jgi:antitoxin ParD1/3/4